MHPPGCIVGSMRRPLLEAFVLTLLRTNYVNVVAAHVYLGGTSGSGRDAALQGSRGVQVPTGQGCWGSTRGANTSGWWCFVHKLPVQNFSCFVGPFLLSNNCRLFVQL